MKFKRWVKKFKLLIAPLVMKLNLNDPNLVLFYRALTTETPLRTQLTGSPLSLSMILSTIAASPKSGSHSANNSMEASSPFPAKVYTKTRRELATGATFSSTATTLRSNTLLATGTDQLTTSN